jgi:hypothetical protein
MPRFHLRVTLPHLKVKDAVHEIIAEAGTPSAAVARGLRAILQRPGVKGKRHPSLTLSLVRVVEATVSATAEE